MHCIVVDDMGPMRRTVTITLEELGITNISEAKNGQDAFELIQASFEEHKDNVELAIVDWNMEPVSGLELLKMVRMDEKAKDIIFVMITAEQLQDNVVAAIQAGVDEYIIKPFTPNIVREKFINIAKRKVGEIRKAIDDSFNDILPELDSGDSFSWGANEMEQFKDQLLKLIPLSSWTCMVHIEIGRLCLLFKDYKESEQWLRKAIVINFGASEAHHLLSRVLRAAGKIPESVKELEIAVVEKPGSGELKQKLGEAYLHERNYDKALTLLTESIRLFEKKKDNKQMAKSKNARGETKLAKGEEINDDNLKEEAVIDISDAVMLDPGLVSAHYNLVMAYKATGRLEEANEVLQRIHSMEPKDAEGWVALGKAFHAKSEISKVKFAFNKAGELADGNFAIYEEISSFLYKHKMVDEAIVYLDKAKEANPSDVFSYNLKGIIFRMRDNNEAAVKEYESAIKLEPDNAGLHFNLGVAHFKSGKEQKSKEFFMKAKELDPDTVKDVDEYIKRMNI